MTYNQARSWIVSSSLAMLALFGSFLIVAPATAYPLFFDQSIQILQVIFPVFIGYLSAAVVFVTSGKAFQGRKKVNELTSLLIKGIFYLSLGLFFIIFTSFGFENWPRENSVVGSFSFENLSTLTSLILGLHTGVASGLIGYLFQIENK